MRLKSLSLTAIAFASAICASAMPWSLDSCINYALEHNIQIKRQALNRHNAELSVTEAKDAYLPQLHAGADQSFNFGR
ncbi:MAG: TolC family protein, partial [Prevotella sp.]|nr:TolC family protein [Prevotella sp.]